MLFFLQHTGWQDKKAAQKKPRAGRDEAVEQGQGHPPTPYRKKGEPASCQQPGLTHMFIPYIYKVSGQDDAYFTYTLRPSTM